MTILSLPTSTVTPNDCHRSLASVMMLQHNTYRQRSEDTAAFPRSVPTSAISHSHRHNTTYTTPQPSSQHHLYNTTATYTIPQPSSQHHLYNTTAIVTPLIQYHSHRHNTTYTIPQPLIQYHSHRHNTTYTIPQPSSHHLYNTTAIVTTPLTHYHSHRHTTYTIPQPQRVARTTGILGVKVNGGVAIRPFPFRSFPISPHANPP